MITRNILPTVLLGALLMPGTALALTKQEVADKLATMEEELMVSQEQFYDIDTQFEKFMDISGYMDLEYQVTDREGDHPQFRMHHFSLFFEKEVTSKWHFFSEIEYEDAPKIEGGGDEITVTDTNGDDQSFETLSDAKGKIFVEAYNITHTLNPMVSVRFGREFTPAGIWNVDHYPPYVPTQERPQHIRRIFPQVTDGLSTLGTIPIGSSFLNYNVYYGNGEGNTGKKDGNSSKSLGLRTSLRMPALTHTEMGLSLYHDKFNNGVTKQSTGVHAKIRTGGFSFQTEYAAAQLEPRSGTAVERSGYYAQFLYDIYAWTMGFRYDVYDDNTDSASESTKYGTVNSLIMNYHSAKNVVLKLEYHMVDIESDAVDDYGKAIASVVVYLGN